MITEVKHVSALVSEIFSLKNATAADDDDDDDDDD